MSPCITGIAQSWEVASGAPGLAIAMLSKGKGFGNWLRLPGRHHSRAHWTRVYDLEQGAWLDSTPAIKYILSHQGTTKPIPAEAKEAATEAATAGPNGKPGQNDVASPERNGKAPKAAPTPSDLDWASTVWPSGTTGAARVRSTRRAVAWPSGRASRPTTA